MFSNKSLKCLIFDWDGTILNSSHRIVSCLKSAAIDLALPPLADEKLSHVIGLSLDGAITFLYPDMDDKTKHAYGQAYKEHYMYKNTEAMPLFDNVESMLADWQKAGLSLAVATGKSRVGLKKDLEEFALEPYFFTTKTADETASKPNPLMLEEILSELDISVEEAVMIGDTSHDINMAKAINMPSIALVQGAHPRSTLEESKPDVILDSIQALPAWLAANT